MEAAIADSPARHAHRESTALDVWTIGPWKESEFHHVTPGSHPGENWLPFDSIEAAVTAIAAEQFTQPAVVLLATPRPNRAVPQRLEQLLAIAPLTRAVVVAGAWCEGEFRTGRPPAGVHRVYWHQFPAWWRRSRRLIEQGLPPLWSYPPGMRADGTQDTDTQTLPVIVSAPDHAVFLSLRDVLQPMGFSCEWQSKSPVESHNSHAAAIVDGGQFDTTDTGRLSAARQAIGPLAPVTLLLDFPRAEHLPQATAAGATTVLGKPYALDDLVESLRLTTLPPAE